MRFATVVDAYTSEKGFRTVQNAYTATLTITAGTIAIGSPVIYATNTASLPAVNTGTTLPGTNRNNFVQNAATSTSLVNNLMLGILAAGIGSKAYLDREEIGAAQCYGPYLTAFVKRRADATGQVVGAALIPELVGSGTGQLGVLLPIIGPMTVNAITTSSDFAAPVEVPGLGCLAVAMQAIASSSATETGTAIVHLRCM